jgi:hypothetical protein
MDDISFDIYDCRSCQKLTAVVKNEIFKLCSHCGAHIDSPHSDITLKGSGLMTEEGNINGNEKNKG